MLLVIFFCHFHIYNYALDCRGGQTWHVRYSAKNVRGVPDRVVHHSYRTDRLVRMACFDNIGKNEEVPIIQNLNEGKLIAFLAGL